MSQSPIQEMKTLLKELRAANQRSLDPIAIARLRAQFNQVMTKLSDSAISKPELEARFHEIQGKASLHQLKWGTYRMIAHPQQYRADSEALGSEMRLFLDWILENPQDKSEDQRK